MNITDIIFAKKLAGGGGGGSSDFSTAEVTFTFVNNPALHINSIFISPFGMVFGGAIGPDIGRPYEQTIVLYQGEQYIDITDVNDDEFDPASLTISVTGDIELDPEGEGVPYFYIRGNGTINIEFAS